MPNLAFSLNTGHTYIGPTTVAVDAQGRPIDQTGTDFGNYSFSINSNISVFDWGNNVSRLRQSKSNATASGFDLQYQKDVITAIVIREYYDLVKQNKLRQVQEEDVEAKRRNLKQIEAFYNIGSRTRADFLQARVDLANSELLLLNARNTEALADARLRARLNLSKDDKVEVNQDSAITPEDHDIDAEIAYMLDHRSSLLSGKYRVEAAGSGLRVAKTALLPTVGAGFSYSWSDREWPDNSNFFEQDYSWGIGVQLSWTAFDRFQTKSRIQDAKAQLRIAEYNLHQSKLNAILDVEQIIVNLSQARERLHLADESVTLAQENLRLAEERYRVGAGTVLETIEAAAALTRAQASLIEAQIDFLVNRADLSRATGRPISNQ
jgi:outer membrane protein TolC